MILFMKLRHAAAAAAIIVTGCGSAATTTSSPAQQIAPGSAVVPCSQIAGQVRQLGQLYAGYGPGNASTTPMYSLETALTARFDNVSNLDHPQDLAEAEVNFVVDYGFVTKDEPFSNDLQDDTTALANVCHVIR
jgi:hypothetical protein